jgi:hypothetical protein
MDEETKKDTRQMMQKNDNAPCNIQPIRAKDQAPSKKNMVLKRKTRRRKFCQETGLPLHPTRLSVIPARYPIRIINQIDKGIGVPQIMHSPIHVAFQCIPGRGQLQLPFPLLINLINVGAVHALNSCGSCVGWEVG